MIVNRRTTRLVTVLGLFLAIGSLPAEGQVRPSWSRMGSMPFERAEVAVAGISGKLYVISGQSKGVDANAFNWEYDLLSGGWRERAMMPAVASHAGAAALNGKVYVIGGFVANVHAGAVDRVFEYDAAKDTWRALAHLSAPRGAVGVVVFDGKIHAIGGRDVNRKTVATHEVYDPAANTWTLAAPLPLARDHLGIAVLAGRIHVVGGRLDAPVDNTAQHDVYDAATDTWTKGAPLRIARSAGVAFVLKNRMIYAGGECKDAQTGTTFSEAEAYDAATNTWEYLPSLNPGRHAAAALSLNGEAYIVGGNFGCGGTKPTTDVVVFRWP